MHCCILHTFVYAYHIYEYTFAGSNLIFEVIPLNSSKDGAQGPTTSNPVAFDDAVMNIYLDLEPVQMTFPSALQSSRNKVTRELKTSITVRELKTVYKTLKQIISE
jgi:hypothetical protein